MSPSLASSIEASALGSAADKSSMVCPAPQCRKPLRIPPDAQGKAQCRHCRHIFEIGQPNRQIDGPNRTRRPMMLLLRNIWRGIGSSRIAGGVSNIATGRETTVSSDRGTVQRTNWSWQISWRYRPRVVRRSAALVLVVAALAAAAMFSRHSPDARTGQDPASQRPAVVPFQPPPGEKRTAAAPEIVPPPPAAKAPSGSSAGWPSFEKPLRSGEIEVQFENRQTVAVTIGICRGSEGADIAVNPGATRSLWIEAGSYEFLRRANDGSASVTREPIMVDHSTRYTIGGDVPASH